MHLPKSLFGDSCSVKKKKKISYRFSAVFFQCKNQILPITAEEPTFITENIGLPAEQTFYSLITMTIKSLILLTLLTIVPRELRFNPCSRIHRSDRGTGKYISARGTCKTFSTIFCSNYRMLLSSLLPPLITPQP